MTRRLVLILAFILFLGFAALLILNRSMNKQYIHDESQFIASGYVLAYENLLPYRDYPYFHTPNLVFVYSILERATPYKLMVVRAFSVLCGWLTVTAVSFATFHLLKPRKIASRLLGGLLAGAYLLASPLFAYTSGMAWNHDPAVLLALLASFALVAPAQQKRHQTLWAACAGFLLALAVGTRSSFFTLIPAFLVAYSLHPSAISRRDSARLILWFGLGGLVGMLPSLVLFLMAPREFIFGNLTYARLNTLYRLETGIGTGLGLWQKTLYFINAVIGSSSNLLLIAASLAFILIPSLKNLFNNKKIGFEPAFILLTLLGLTWGAFLPDPIFYQYIYALVPFSILAVAWSASQPESGFSSTLLHGTGKTFFIVAVCGTILFGLKDVNVIASMSNIPGNWVPYILHQQGVDIARRVPVRKVLTFSPVIPIEGRRTLYPEFVTGTFAFRVADLLPPEERARFQMVGPDELEDFLSPDPPGLIETGSEPEDVHLESYAHQNGYGQVESYGIKLWVK